MKEQNNATSLVRPILSRMDELGVSQHKLARMSGVHYNTIHRMCVGTQIPTWETRQKLRRALSMQEEKYFTTEQRNDIFLDLETAIRCVISKNQRALRAVRADKEDVFQDLSCCAIRAIDRYDPTRFDANVKTFVMKNVELHIKQVIENFRKCGFVGHTAIGLKAGTVVSLDSMMENGFQFDGAWVAIS